MWITRRGPRKVGDKRACGGGEASPKVWSSRRGSQRHRRLHQRSGGGSFGTFRCPPVRGPHPPRSRGVLVAGQGALQAAHDLGGLVRGVTRLRGGSGEGPELAVTRIA